MTVGNLRGVLDSSVLYPEPGPQGPFITYNYYVTYDCVEDEDGEGSQYGGVLAEVGAWGSSAPGSSEPPVQTGWLEGPKKPLNMDLPNSCPPLNRKAASAQPLS